MIVKPINESIRDTLATSLGNAKNMIKKANKKQTNNMSINMPDIRSNIIDDMAELVFIFFLNRYAFTGSPPNLETGVR